MAIAICLWCWHCNLFYSLMYFNHYLAPSLKKQHQELVFSIHMYTNVFFLYFISGLTSMPQNHVLGFNNYCCCYFCYMCTDNISYVWGLRWWCLFVYIKNRFNRLSYRCLVIQLDLKAVKMQSIPYLNYYIFIIIFFKSVAPWNMIWNFFSLNIKSWSPQSSLLFYFFCKAHQHTKNCGSYIVGFGNSRKQPLIWFWI